MASLEKRLHGYRVVFTARSRHHIWAGGGGVLSFSLIDDGKQLVAGCNDGAARVWDLSRLAELRHRYYP